MSQPDDTVVKGNPTFSLPGSTAAPPVATILSAPPPGLSGGQWVAPPGMAAAPYPGVYGGGSQVPSWAQPQGTYAASVGPRVVVVTDWDISQMDLVQGQGDTMGKEFLAYGACMSLLTAAFSCLALLMATLGQGLPWILLPLSDLSITDCALAVGLTNFGLLGSSCPSRSTPAGGALPAWPKPLSDPSSRDIFTGSFTGGTIASSCLGIGAVFYFLCIMLATVEVCVTCTALGFVLSWFGSAYGNIWVVGQRKDDWRIGGGQVCAEVLFFMSLLALLFPAILKCRLRDYGFSRKPQLHPQVESLLGGRLMNGGCY